MNNLINVRILNNAAWHRREKLSFNVPNPHAASVSSTSGDRQITVIGNRIDNIIKKIDINDPVSLINMDIEGADLLEMKWKRF
jgi:FkbM family methyltransferase